MILGLVYKYTLFTHALALCYDGAIGVTKSE